MKKRFNDTGSCNPQMHFIVDISNKLNKIIELIERGLYFTMNRPRQYGKTTTQFLLTKRLIQNEDYMFIRISFEGVGETMFTTETNFCQGLTGLFIKRTKQFYPSVSEFFTEIKDSVVNFDILSETISQFIAKIQKKVVLIIDEVDKSSNNQLFLNFLGMLRSKYLLRNDGEDFTFQSVILGGVYDIKTIKLKLHPDTSEKYNSPWNIAVDFNIDLSFSAKEIESLLADYSVYNKILMDIPVIAERIYYYSMGYPYLVSKLCKVVDEELLPHRKNQNRWESDDIDDAYKYLVNPEYSTTLFDSLIKNLENDIDLYNVVQNIVLNGFQLPFNVNEPQVNLGAIYGILSPKNGICVVNNLIFEQRIYNYLIAKKIVSEQKLNFVEAVGKYNPDGTLNFPVILKRFQQFMKENYTEKDIPFIECEGRLLFLSFLKPIINGKGFDFKEPVVGDERRMDIVITFNNIRDVIELKIWRGNEYHQTGLQQLSDYLDIYSLKKGYLLIFNFNASKAYKEELIHFKDKEIFAAWV